MINRKWVQAALSVALVVILGAVVIPGVGAAPLAQGTLEWNAEAISGTLDAATPSTLYMFPCEAGMPGSLVTQTISGDLVTEITVVGPGFEQLGTGGQVSGTQASVIEAFVPTEKGICQAEVAAVNNTSGDYTLRLLSGYGTVVGYNTFDQASEPEGLTWTPFETENVVGELPAGAVQVSIITQNMFGYFTSDESVEQGTDSYFQADVAIQDSPSYIEYGLVFGMAEDGSTFYSFAFSTDGDYSLYYYDDGWTAIQDWVVSDVVDPTDMSPTIAIWLHDGVLSVYFNGALVGDIPNVDSAAFLGYPGISAGTIEDQTDMAVAQFDNIIITTPYTEAAETSGGLLGALGMGNTPQRSTPTPEPQGQTGVTVATGGYPATLQNWDAAQSSVLINELATLGIVPQGGSEDLTVPSTYGESSSEGFNYYPLGRGGEYDDFVLSYDATLTQSGTGSGCGMHFRASNTTSTSALVFADGFAMLAHYGADGSPAEGSIMDYSDLVTTGVGVTHRITVVAVGVNVLMYINGQLLGSIEMPLESGTAALEMYVEADQTTGTTELTHCELDNVWLWSF